MTDPMRLDAALAERGLVRSRTRAARLIRDGKVLVNGVAAGKAAQPVADDDALELQHDEHYVSRAAHKLLAALAAFPIEVAGRTALDVGASTGGFSQVLLEAGAERVLAIDVGHGQLAAELHGHPRLSLAEGVNARELDAARLAGLFGPMEVSLVVADVSFISLTQVLPAVLAATGAEDFVVLIKPQFEVGRSGIVQGVVQDAALRREAVRTVLAAAEQLGLHTAGLIPSPLLGGSGNTEYLAWLSTTRRAHPTEWSEVL